MVYMQEIKDTTYSVVITIVDHIDGTHGNIVGDCGFCGQEDAVAELTYSTDCGTEQETHFRDLCMTCIVPVLDSVSYLDETMPIILEVARVATERPF